MVDHFVLSPIEEITPFYAILSIPLLILMPLPVFRLVNLIFHQHKIYFIVIQPSGDFSSNVSFGDVDEFVDNLVDQLIQPT